MSHRSDLERYAALLTKWNRTHNLVSRETIDQLWPRHIADSLQLVQHVRPTDLRIIDFGSGDGFPAIPLAIALPDRHFTLVEPIAKKAAFLRTIARELGLRVTVEAKRAERIDSRETFDCVTSRVLAALPTLLGYTVRAAGYSSGHCLFLKGRNYREELDAAAQHFHFHVVVHPSESDPEGVVLDISNLRAKSAA